VVSFSAVGLVNKIPHNVNFAILCSHVKKNELPIQLRYFFKVTIFFTIQYLLKANAIPVVLLQV